MFKLKFVWLALPIIGVGILGGCSNMQMSNVSNANGEQYVYHASNGRVFYQASNGRYYFEGKDGRFYSKKYYVKRNGHRYYSYYPDTKMFILKMIVSPFTSERNCLMILCYKIN